MGLGLAVHTSAALDSFSFSAPGLPADAKVAVDNASLLRAARNDKNGNAQDLFAAARADYGRLLGALYAQGYYSGVISIRIDGREASDIAPLDAPASIRSIAVTIQPGPRFTFARARMRPYAPGTKLPPAYGDTRIARSTAITDAADAGVEGWRKTGHAKARVADEKVVADHPSATLDSLILLDPGPKLRFGTVTFSGYDRMLLRRMVKIAGFPTGEVYAPEKLEEVLTRLRRTGVFRSVSATEAEAPTRDGTLPVAIALEEDKLRRLGTGVEVSSSEGLALSGYWLHRNLRGGAERLRFDAEVTGIGAQTGGIDYRLGVRAERPGTFTPDTAAFIELTAASVNEEDFDADTFLLGFGVTHIVNDRSTVGAEIRYSTSLVTDIAGSTRYEYLSLPLSVTYDSRDAPLDATSGLYGRAEATPFLGLNGTDSGARLLADARAYRSFGEDNRFVLAARVQAGSVAGASVAGTPREFLFYSGGGGTVRGQPYQSLGVQVIAGGTVRSGGLSYVALSGEFRADVTDKIGVVAFYDAGYVDALQFFGGSGSWQSGAGIGLRYDTGFGPIRFDIAAPVSGSTGSGVQLYVGIGQAF